MKTLIKHANQKSWIPVLNTIKIHDGIVTAFDIDIEISCLWDKEDGVYCAKGAKAGAWIESGIPMADFPKFDINQNEFKHSARINIHDLEFVSRAMSTEETRYYLNGIHFDGNGIVAMDGHRLHMVKMDTGLNRGNIILPSAAVNYILEMAKEQKLDKIADDGTIYFSDDFFQIQVGKYNMIGKLIDATFPDYNRVIPQKNKMIGVYDLPELKAIEKKAKALHKANGGKRGAAIKFEGNTMRVMAGEYSKDWPCSLSFGNIAIGFNLDYLIDIGLNGADVLAGKAALEPIRLNLGNRIAVLMPVRV